MSLMGKEVLLRKETTKLVLLELKSVLRFIGKGEDATFLILNKMGVLL